MSDKREGKQKGAQEHAEGQHGGRAHERHQEILHSGPSGEEANAQETRGEIEGHHRIYEDREQHDEAEKNSEKNRLQRDIDQYRLDRDDFQVPGQRSSGGLGPDGGNERKRN